MNQLEYNRRGGNTTGERGLGGGDADNSAMGIHHPTEAEEQEEPEAIRVEPLARQNPEPERVERLERPLRSRHRSSRRSRENRGEQLNITVPCARPTPNRQPDPDTLPAPPPIPVEDATQLRRDRPNQLIRFVLRLGYNALLYPYEVAKILIQMGHEPLKAKAYALPLVSQRPRYYFVGVHRYVQYIRQVDGFRGLYRGLGARLLATSVDYLMGDLFLHLLGLKPYRRNTASDPAPAPKIWFGGLKEFLYNMLRDSIRLTTAIALSQPFYVIMCRQIAQFVGRESTYEGIYSSLVTVIDREGWQGLYAGVVPRLLGEGGVLFITSAASHVCRNFLPITRVQQQYNAVIFQMLASVVFYPLEVAGTCMACTGAPLVACEPPNMPLYMHWADCLTDLYARGGHNRGAILFWRTVPRIQLQRYNLEGRGHDVIRAA
ncbi:hypothetical protein KR009_011471 [Drosophila setifemur]|nr:hypothetical protein KR009_011471 [Drosophila setifemur]